MLKNIYTPLSGALAQEKVLDIIANNLANVNTTGFKGESVTFKLVDPEPAKHYKDPLPPANYKIDVEDLSPLKGNEFSYTAITDVHKDLTQGPAIATKNHLDMMIEGEGYFTVHTDEGPRFTRDGAFSISPEGLLIDKRGNAILGENGTIFARGNKLEVNNLGEVYLDGEMVDRLLVQKFDNPQSLEKLGENLLFYGGPEEGVETVEYAGVKQGYLEGSNVNAIKNLTSMIISHRSFEAYQKTIKSYDSMMDKSSNSIGVVRT